MKLLENVKGRSTSPESIASAMEMGKALGKVAVLVGNCDGFVGNRMLFKYRSEANFLLEEGCLPAQVDKIIYGFGMPMGPFTMSDMSGVDISWRIRKGKGLTDPRTRPKNIRYCEIGDRLCEKGRFGQKTQAGFYRYDPKIGGGRKALPDATVDELIIQYSSEKGIERRNILEEEVLERCWFPLINEGFRILEEGIAKGPEDIDVIWIYGYGWPRYRGGPMFYAEEDIGLDRLLAGLKKYNGMFPKVEHWRPSRLLQDIVDSGLSLYDYWRRTGGDVSKYGKKASNL